MSLKHVQLLLTLTFYIGGSNQLGIMFNRADTYKVKLSIYVHFHESQYKLIKRS